jgi:predicted Kef-type K+ transport protein
MDPHAFLQNLAVVLCVAAVATVVFQRLHQPVIFGYLLAGMIIGPHIPIPLVADPQTVRALSELGVILLMFSPNYAPSLCSVAGLLLALALESAYEDTPRLLLEIFNDAGS